jgi:excisionase family DNA binding protein
MHTMSMTLAEAAAACGIDKSTVRRAVRSGRISGVRDELGVWRVEPVELHRIFPPAVARTEGAPAAAPLHAPPDAAAAANGALVAELRAVIADLRQDRDHWREQAQRLALPKPAEREADHGQAKRRSWWPWRRAG